MSMNYAIYKYNYIHSKDKIKRQLLYRFLCAIVSPAISRQLIVSAHKVWRLRWPQLRDCIMARVKPPLYISWSYWGTCTKFYYLVYKQERKDRKYVDDVKNTLTLPFTLPLALFVKCERWIIPVTIRRQNSSTSQLVPLPLFNILSSQQRECQVLSLFGF